MGLLLRQAITAGLVGPLALGYRSDRKAAQFLTAKGGGSVRWFPDGEGAD